MPAFLLTVWGCNDAGNTGRGADAAPGAGGRAQGTGAASPTGGTVTSTGGVPTGGARSGGIGTGGAAGSAGDASASGGAGTGGMAGSRAAGGATGNGGIASTDDAGARDAGWSRDVAGRGGAGGSDGAAVAGTGGSIVSASAGPPESKPSGYGQATTGAGSLPAVEASSLSALQAAMDAYAGSGGLSLRYTGKFDFSTITDPCAQWQRPAQVLEIKKKSDITLVGADGSAANFGIHIAASSSNIVVRNMTMALLPGGDASDAITLEGMSGGAPNNIWIDHNTLSSSLVECDGAGDTSFDGLIDIKKGADNVTVSYNYLHDHPKVSLNGYSDSDTAARHVTFHHNVVDNVGSRTPLQRGGRSHVLNNLLSRIATSGINVRMDGYSLVEGNYFENVRNPVTSRDSDAIGYWELRDNNITTPADFAKFAITWVASESTPTVDATDWKTTAVFPAPLGYTYTPQAPGCVKEGLRAVAGAGKGLATLACK